MLWWLPSPAGTQQHHGDKRNALDLVAPVDGYDTTTTTTPAQPLSAFILKGVNSIATKAIKLDQN